ncbi:MAG TPA: TolC family protein, partial [Pyrinomonadaceae bacterium]|nr:TolC family protein [Pyrinomonadaceae bacterium]
MLIHTLFKYRLTAITMMLLALTFQTATTFAQTRQSGSPVETTAASATPVTAMSPSPSVSARTAPHTVRVGIDASAPVPLTLQEAIRLALANNNDIATSRIDVEMSEHDLNAARGAYDPILKSEYK